MCSHTYSKDYVLKYVCVLNVFTIGVITITGDTAMGYSTPSSTAHSCALLRDRATERAPWKFGGSVGVK